MNDWAHLKGPLCLRKVEKVVKSLGLKSISLQVEEVNNNALEIYKKNGFEEMDRRSYIPFPGADDTGDFILMVKNLTSIC